MAMNQTRAEFDLSRLRTDPKLNRAARAYAKELASRQLLDHTDLDGNGPGKRVDDVGYRWMFVAENLAAGQDDVKQVVKDWMESPPHRKALLNDKPVHVGIGFVKTSSDALVDPYGSYWVALFAKPR